MERESVIKAILILVVVVVAGFGVIKIQSSFTGETVRESTPEKTETTDWAGKGQAKEIVVKGTEYEFNPPTLTVDKGEKMKVIFKNIGSTGHNFVIDELGVSTGTVSPGSTETVEFTASKTGTFDFYCSLPGHRSAGMEGQITVS